MANIQACDENTPGSPCGACLSCLRAQVELRTEQRDKMERELEGVRQRAAKIRTEDEETIARTVRRATEAEAACAVVRKALDALLENGGVGSYFNEQMADPSFRRTYIEENYPAAITADAGKLAAEVLRAADEWERESTRLYVEQKATTEGECDTGRCCALSDAVAAAVRLRRNAR